MLRLGEENAHRYARLAALWQEVKSGNLDQRIARCYHAHKLDMVVFSHRAVDLNRERNGIAVWKGSWHRKVTAIRFHRYLSGQSLNQFCRVIARAGGRDDNRCC